MSTHRPPARVPAAVPAGPAAEVAPGPGRTPLVAPLVVAVAGAVLAAALGCLLGGAALPSAFADADPGPLVRWGLPLVRGVGDLAASLTIGALVLAAVALPVAAGGRGRGSGRGAAAGPGRAAPAAFAPALTVAAVAAAAWAVTSLAGTVLAYADLAGLPLDDPQFGDGLAAFVRGDDLGRGLLVTTALAAVVATAAAGVRSLAATGLLALLAFAGLVPAALAGHSGGADHETAVTSLGLHLVGATVWVGGLGTLLVLRRRLGGALAPASGRYSTLAGWAFVAVAVSGVVNAWLRLPTPSALLGGYGVLVLLKTLALVVLGVVGALHRRRTLPRLAAGAPGAFARLAAVELAVMAVAVGLAAALSRTAPPAPTDPPRPLTLAESLTGRPLPAPPSASTWFTAVQPDLLWLVVAALAAVGYAGGVRRLARRGDSWPVLRTVTWFLGLAVLVWATSGGPAVYGRVLFSAHMVGHMTLAMIAPVLLVAGAPVTLALRTLRPRTDGSRGPREWLLAAVESRPLRVLAHPAVAGVLFAGSLVVFYYSPLFGLALRTHLGHELMTAHFLLAGYLFAWVLVGVDPGPHRPPPALRLLVLLATMAFHAFFGVALLAGTQVLAPDWFGGLGRTWGSPLLADQRLGGGIAWGLGELPTLALLLVIVAQWTRSDEREARRHDRKAARDGDADLTAYNAMLARLAEADGQAAGQADGQAAGQAAGQHERRP